MAGPSTTPTAPAPPEQDGETDATPGPVAPPRWKLAILTWIVVYPTITLILALLGPVINTLPLLVQTLVLTLLLVPAMTFVLVPLASRALRPWLSGPPPAA